MTFVVLFDVPYDEWEVELVTNNKDNAINKIKTSHANCIQIWINENMIENFNFTKRYDWDTQQEYKESFQYHIEQFNNIISNINL